MPGFEPNPATVGDELRRFLPIVSETKLIFFRFLAAGKSLVREVKNFFS